MRKIIDGKESKITEIINRLGDGISKTSTCIDGIKGRWLEACVMLLYTIMHFVMSYFHEPWFDEGEAWQIARCASFHELMFKIPHLEGHSPMWDFILVPWIKLGVPYETSLALISFIFMGTAVALIIWKAPWPRIIRLLIPFTYFFLYQYGVICRPYCVLACLLILVAYLYPSKDEKPGRFVICLALLAYIHAYGLLMAGGIAIVWLIEMQDGRKITEFVKSLPKDKRVWMLLGLLAVAVLTVLQILPGDDTFAMLEQYELNGPVKRIVYVMFALPAETTFTTVWQGFYGLARAELGNSFIYISIGSGIVFWIVAIAYARKIKKVLLLVLPYSFFAFFAGYTYISRHHIGVGLLWIVAWSWMAFDTKEDFEQEKEVLFKGENGKLINSTLKIFAVLIFSVSLYWSVFACVTEINNSYTVGRKEADFIKENDLLQYNIMVEYDVVYYEGTKDIAYYFFNAGFSPNILPYFSKNVFYNCNDGRDDQGYVTHHVNSKEEDEMLVERLKNIRPEVIVGEPKLEAIYGNKYNIEEDYTLVYYELCIGPWKDTKDVEFSKIYVLNEIALEKDLKSVYNSAINGH